MMSYKRGIFVLFGSTFFSKKTGKVVHDANRYKMLDVSALSIEHKTFNPEKCKSKFASLLFMYLFGRYWQIFKPKTRIFRQI